MSGNAVVIEPDQPATGSVIWMHGLGADGHDFEPIVAQLRLKAPIRFVFPHAPVQPVTINGGMEMRAWFDILSLDKHGAADGDGITASCEMIDSYIEQELAAGIPENRIVLAGFSQGGVIAMHTALNGRRQLAGLIAISTYLPLSERIAESVAELPLFVAHGTFDNVLAYSLGEETRDILAGKGYQPEWHSYPMAHGVCPQEIMDIKAWFEGVFAE